MILNVLDFVPKCIFSGSNRFTYSISLIRLSESGSKSGCNWRSSAARGAVGPRFAFSPLWHRRTRSLLKLQIAEVIITIQNPA